MQGATIKIITENSPHMLEELEILSMWCAVTNTRGH